MLIPLYTDHTEERKQTQRQVASKVAEAKWKLVTQKIRDEKGILKEKGADLSEQIVERSKRAGERLKDQTTVALKESSRTAKHAEEVLKAGWPKIALN